MAIKIEMLRCFKAVADHGALADAAQVLNRTPSAVSMMLRQFEDHVGAPLFETGRKSRLTPLGELIRQEAGRELAHFERTVSAIEGLARAERGFVRIIATPSIAQIVMPPVLRRYIADHPAVRIDMRDADSATIEQELRSEGADIGLASLGPIPGFDRRRILSDRFGVVCRADHPLTWHWQTLTWADLHGTAFIANGLCRQIEDDAFAPLLEAARLSVRNTASILSLVRAGVGITVLPELAVLPEFSDLAFLPLQDVSARREVFIFTPDAALMTPAARDMAAAILASELQPD
ncbi:MAG: LysR family transcriptional regulator [Roseovarius sp.]|uniref:LysR family transcriptional regulator n=1 Tax=Roseovarius sp. TaxID=1486281 RepID=UPI0032EB2F48